MQTMLGTEFGGMNAVLTELYQQTGDGRRLTRAQRFDHAAVFNPLASNSDRRPPRVGPAWGGGTWSTDYNSFWCCQGTGVEVNTSLMDSIYSYNGTTLFVNLFAPSMLNWSQRGISVTQTTSYPASDTTTLQVTGNASGSWTMRVRIPA
jgi:DUF1680 family protein